MSDAKQILILFSIIGGLIIYNELWRRYSLWHDTWENPVLKEKFTTGMKQKIKFGLGTYRLQHAIFQESNLDRKMSLPIIIGRESKKNHVVDLIDVLHILIGGASGWGKSNFLNNILDCLKNLSKDKYQLWLIDPNDQESIYFKEEENVRIGVAMEESTSMLKDLCKEMARREEVLKGSKYDTLYEYNKAGNEPMPYLVVIIDEFVSFGAENKFFNELVEHLSMLGRLVGIHLILTTQQPDANVLTGQIKDNMGAVVCFRTATATNSNIVLGRDGAEKLEKKGEAILGIGAKFFTVQTPLNAITPKK